MIEVYPPLARLLHFLKSDVEELRVCASTPIAGLPRQEQQAADPHYLR